MTLKEQLATAQKGFPVPKSTVTIRKVYPRMEGEGNYGPWSLQNAETECGVSLTFDKMPDQSHLQGKTITIESSIFKGSPAGFKFDVYIDKNGKERRSIKVSRAANISMADGSMSSAPAAAPAPSGSITLETMELMIRRVIREELTNLVAQATADTRIDGADKVEQDGLPF